MRITISLNDLDSIKIYLGRSIPEHKASWRIEAVGRGLGYNTYSGLRKALAGGPIVVQASDQHFCKFLGVPFETGGEDRNRVLSRSLARVGLHRILDAHEELTLDGFDGPWMGDARQLKLPLNERKALFTERRQKAYESDWGFDQFELAWIYLSRQRKIKSINRKMSSYGLKHRAENLQREFGLFKPLGNYVSNGALIAAAYALGFQVKRAASGSYSAYLNISMATVNQSRGQQPRSEIEDRSLVDSMYGDIDQFSA